MNWYGTKGSYSITPETCIKYIGEPVSTLCRWEDLKEAGIISSRSEYLDAVRKTAMFLAEIGIAKALDEKDTELLQMVRTLDELDRVINLMTECVTEWYQAITPSSSRKYIHVSPEKMLTTLSKSGQNALKSVSHEILSMLAVRTKLMKEVSSKADAIIPNMSALVGGLVAARLISHAGGLNRISRMSGSSIQVLGAESALFSHIRTGSPSPKHGLIFQHRRIHNAPREVRGKVSRLLSTKLAVASRIDLFRGERDAVFLESANAKIDALIKREKV